MFEDLP